MNQNLIFWPAIAQAALTLLVAVRMYLVRVAEMRERRVRPQLMATRREAGEALRNTAAADNFSNLFELPVLFFAICPALAITGLVTPAQLGLAWAFVALRAAHSTIHVTYNRVMHRFQVYVLGMVCVFAMWGLFAAQLWSAGGRAAP
ncbi:MAG: MAPEG family protein [Steroidobacteraceae bacterium]